MKFYSHIQAFTNFHTWRLVCIQQSKLLWVCLQGPRVCTMGSFMQCTQYRVDENRALDTECKCSGRNRTVQQLLSHQSDTVSIFLPADAIQKHPRYQSHSQCDIWTPRERLLLNFKLFVDQFLGLWYSLSPLEAPSDWPKHSTF